MSTGADDETLAAQRDRLARLQEHEKEIRALRERESDLEVERIAAEAALGAASAARPANLDAGAILAVARSMERKHGVEDALESLDTRLARRARATPEELRRLRNACEALHEWLDAAQAGEPARVKRAGGLALLAVIIGCIWAAVALHPAFLLLLVVIAGPISFLMYRGQDAQWRRLGFRRRFEATGLEPPAQWQEPAVRARLESLEAALEATASAGETADAPDDALLGEHAMLAEELAAAERNVAAAMADAGLDPDDVDEGVERWLLLAGHAERARDDLAETKSRLKAAREEAETIREKLFRYLSRRGEAPAGARADAEAIAAGLERLAASGRAGNGQEDER